MDSIPDRKSRLRGSAGRARTACQHGDFACADVGILCSPTTRSKADPPQKKIV